MAKSVGVIVGETPYQERYHAPAIYARERDKCIFLTVCNISWRLVRACSAARDRYVMLRNECFVAESFCYELRVYVVSMSIVHKNKETAK